MTTELYDVFEIIIDVLKANDGLCMDGEAERAMLASAIVDALDEAEMLAGGAGAAV